MTIQRLNRLYEAMQQQADLVAVNPGPTLTYLTGLHFHLMERPTLLLARPSYPAVIVLPALELGKVEQSRIELKAFSYDDNPATWLEAFQSAAAYIGLAGARVAVEPTRLRFLEIEFLRQAASNSYLVSGDRIFSSLRMCKDAEEIAAMRQAVKIAQTGLLNTIPYIKAGVSEMDVAAELTVQLLRAGSISEMPFAPIVASGPNSANPHAVPTPRKLTRGDLLVIDWGAAYNDYCSDLTRTFAIGSIEPEFSRIAEIVLAANTAGRLAGQPGIPAGDVDRAARKAIADNGYAQYFTHRTGHGLGMEGHEPPYIFAENNLLLQNGMAYTVEPGIYLPGRGGVRIEDDMIVTETGSESLSDLPRELKILE